MTGQFSAQLQSLRELTKKERTARDNSMRKSRGSLKRNSVILKSNVNAGTRTLQKKLQNFSIQQTSDKKDMVKKTMKKYAVIGSTMLRLKIYLQLAHHLA